ncbi:MAG: hypothetical protein HZA90_26105 [Verrucomicrobia bacterium]|nr:hypothetical protein [Verrucomicrobiota bacterium]
MILQFSHWQRNFSGLALGVCLCLATVAHAQQRGGFGTGGFGTGGTGRSSSSSGSRQYLNNSMVGDATVSSDPETRRIIVITDDETSEFVSQVITNLDRPKPQVLIKVVFLEVTHNDGTDIGFEGGVKKGLDSTTSGTAGNLFGLGGLTNSVPLADFAKLGAIASPAAGGLYQILGKDYQVTLKAIASAGKAKVLSRPSVLARNNQPATIVVGQTVPLVTSVRYDQYGNAINGITYTDVGIILRVTPFITSDGMVEMIVSPEISSVSPTDKTPIDIVHGAYAPFIDKRSADTVVVTPDGQTVIIGGLIQNQKSQTESKIPLLGDIPGLGALFKRKTTTDAKTELLIFLTPQIVQAPTQLAALSTREKANVFAPNAFTEQELNKFLDTLPPKIENTAPAPDDGRRNSLNHPATKRGAAASTGLTPEQEAAARAANQQKLGELDASGKKW